VCTIAKDTLPDASQTYKTYPDILLEAGVTTNKVTTPEGDVSDASMDYTLSKKGEGDNISGNKELRNEGENEDEKNSKRPKVPLHTPTQNERTPTTPHQPHRTQTKSGP
jgi:hypothetical protein